MGIPYQTTGLPRELKRHYISATDNEIQLMLDSVGEKSLDDLYSNIDKKYQFQNFSVCEEMEYEDLVHHMTDISKKNNTVPCFIGDGLKWYKTPKVISDICAIRGLTTAYTPYQPERSQGTLTTLWIYASTLSELTGFEAINASLYERSTCLFEAIQTARKAHKKGDTALIVDDLYPQDKIVLETLVAELDLKLKFLPIDQKTGVIDPKSVTNSINEDVFCLVFSQVNNLGLISPFNQLTDICYDNAIKSIALFDPKHLGPSGLKRPADFGRNGDGVDIIVAEGQHLCLGPNCGGPGLGIFGVRFNDQNKTMIRNTPGRYIGAARDSRGRECKVIVLSTREQHIRRDKATSNICSNQSFVASIAGASMLIQGAKGFKESFEISRQRALKAAQKLGQYKGVKLAFPNTPFINEFVLELGTSSQKLVEKAQKKGLQIGISLNKRNNLDKELLMLFFNDIQSDADISKLYDFFDSEFEKDEQSSFVMDLESKYLNTKTISLKNFSEDKILKYYQDLGEQNVSPDDAIYPLGSCTMKYNPHINDYCASLSGFTQIHPQAPDLDKQGCLQVLFEIQEYFKSITGLPGVTTQPVAGAQGELVGIKLFQAYHKAKNENRDIILVPKSAHGTNPATATMAGFVTKGMQENATGIILIGAQQNGLIDFEDLKSKVDLYKNRIAGIMITNPNTSGVFEENFKEVADLIHSIDGLVYMDGANMNAIAGYIDLDKIGVDAVHNNLHKTWTIPHGGGGPGDAIVAVSSKLVDYLPGVQIKYENGKYLTYRTENSIGDFHRHYGNFAHKVRCLTYIKRLGSIGIKKMSAFSVLSARYLHERLKKTYPTLPIDDSKPKMHEFIITLSPEVFTKAQGAGIAKAHLIARVGKLFLDYGLHAPTVAFPEQYGLMIEPTESFTKSELDRFCEVAESIHFMINEYPQVLKTVPHFTPIDRVDEVDANKNLRFSEIIDQLPQIIKNRVNPKNLMESDIEKLQQEIITAHSKEISDTI